MRDSAPDGSSPRDCALLLAMEDNLKIFLSFICQSKKFLICSRWEYDVSVECLSTIIYDSAGCPFEILVRNHPKILSNDFYASCAREKIVSNDVFLRLSFLTSGGVLGKIDGTRHCCVGPFMQS